MEKYDTGETRISREGRDGAPNTTPKQSDDLDEIIGRVLDDRFHISERLGEGGMSAVFGAEHLLLDKCVAVKLLHRHLCSNVNSIQRFHREAKAISSLDHENIVKVHAFGQTSEGHCYLVMDLVRAQSLADLLKAQTRLPLDRAMGIFESICNGLSHIHDHGIVHRDLKPGNIMAATDENEALTVKIVDFGIAFIANATEENGRLTEAGSTCGSPPYMSPEQCLGQRTDSRSDIYSLGCLFFEVLTGLRPFQGESGADVMVKHVNVEPPRIAPEFAVPPAMEAIIQRCLRKLPSERYQSVNEVLADLKQVGTNSAQERILSESFDRRTGLQSLQLPRSLAVGLTTLIAVGLAVAAFFMVSPSGRIVLLSGGVEKALAGKGTRRIDDLASRVYELADLYLQTGQKDDFNRVLKSFGDRVCLMKEHRKAAQLLSDVSDRLNDAQSYALAREFARKSVEAMKKEADACSSRGDLAGKMKAMHECVMLTQKAGLPAAQTMQFLFALSVDYKSLGRFRKAEELVSNVVKIASGPPKDEQSLLYANHQLAEIYLCQGRVAPAILLLESNVAVARRLYREASPFFVQESTKLQEMRLLSHQSSTRKP